MTLLQIAMLSATVLLVAYFTYGRLLSKLLRLNPQVKTPAYELQDDLDFVPTEPQFLLSQHFSAIAAAGPIVGPILAGIAFGWLPALIWILVGSILIGGVHDMTALTASIRHKARSIAEVVREHMSWRSYLLFLSFIWIALIYIIVAFTDITAQSFVLTQKLENGDTVSGGAIASSSLLYLVLPIIMGLLLRFTKLSLNVATVIFVLLIGASIYVGQYIPLDFVQVFQLTGTAAEQNLAAQKIWDVLLLIYCVIAGVIPVWLLLQPRGHLGGYFLYIALAAGVVGLLFSQRPITHPAFIGWQSVKGEQLFPMLFIMIACGACSGFHALIASGTTSKQLRRETDARTIGYGSMLLEAMVAVISLSCVMIALPGSGTLNMAPNGIYAAGVGSYVELLGIPAVMAASFALMAFTTFVFDTLDVCTRLGRYIIQELLGRHDAAGRWIGTLLTAGIPVFFVLQTSLDSSGKPQEVWRAFWPLFGASNQLLAALTLLGITVWLWRTRREMWVWVVTGIPTVWMYVMSSWALLVITRAKFLKKESGEFQLTSDPVAWAGVVLLALAALMLVEAMIVLFNDRGNRRGQLAAAAVAAGAN